MNWLIGIKCIFWQNRSSHFNDMYDYSESFPVTLLSSLRDYFCARTTWSWFSAKPMNLWCTNSACLYIDWVKQKTDYLYAHMCLANKADSVEAKHFLLNVDASRTFSIRQQGGSIQSPPVYLNPMCSPTSSPQVRSAWGTAKWSGTCRGSSCHLAPVRSCR